MKKQLLSLLLATFFAAFAFAFATHAQTFAGQTLMHDGAERTYILHLPANYDPLVAHPLVFVLHGLGDSPANFMNGTGFNAISDANGFIAVYPATLDMLFGMTAWNSGANPLGQADDVGFISALIDELDGQYNIDLDRVYATGFSMGGIMSHRLACELEDRIAAIASGSGTMANPILESCESHRPTPVFHLHGTADGTVNYDGTPLFFLSSVEETINFWVDAHACNADVVLEDLPDAAADGYTIERSTYSPCTDNSEVVLYTVSNMPHTWLGAGNDLNESQQIWDFFSQYSLRAASEPTAVADLSGGEIAAYPNPFGNRIEVKLPQGMYSRLSLFNAQGKLVNQVRVYPSAGELTLSGGWLDKLPGGMYILKAEAGDGKTVPVSLRLLKK